MTYTHTQTGAIAAIVIAVGLALVVAIAFPVLLSTQPPVSPYVWLVMAGSVAIVAISIFAFSRMTIEVRDGVIKWSFGSGFPRFTIPLSEVQSAQPVKNPWFYGIGIHLTPSGWLYNVAMGPAVEITRVSGRRVRLGTDEPDALVAAIVSARTGTALR